MSNVTQHLLIPIDESDQSTRALEYAFTVFPDATVTVLHVLDPSELLGSATMDGSMMATTDAGGMGVNFEELQAQQEETAKEVFDEAREIANAHAAEIKTVSRTGGVSQSIVDYADENNIDHIVIGSHGRTGASRVLLGSVAETVVRRSPLPVTVV